MNNLKRVLINLAIVLSSSVVGALLMTGLDAGGARWIKFGAYILFFASIISPSVLFPNSSCSLSRWRRRRS